MSMPENLPTTIFAEAWATLYNCFGERCQQEELDLMDAVLAGIVSDQQEHEKQVLGEEKET